VKSWVLLGLKPKAPLFAIQDPLNLPRMHQVLRDREDLLVWSDACLRNYLFIRGTRISSTSKKFNNSIFV
jgi:hypothetical protein